MVITKKTLTDIISTLLILLLGYAAMNKLLQYERFTDQIGQSPILKDIAGGLAWMIPFVELLACILMIIPKYRLHGLYLSLILMISFTIYIAAILTLSVNVPCSCGGVLSLLGWKSHLIFNIVFTGLSATAVLLEKQHAKTETGTIQINYSNTDVKQ